MRGARAVRALTLLLILVAACGRAADPSRPSVKIVSPPDPHAIRLGERVEVESRAHADGGLRSVALYVDEMRVQTVPVPDGEKSFRSVQSWQPTHPGQYLISVVAYDDRGQVSEPADVLLTVQVAGAQIPTPPNSATPLPAPTAGATPGGVSDPDCTYGATFVTDVTIPDDTVLAPGTEFVKTWRLRNTGTCPWEADFRFVFIGGAQMGGPAAVDVPPTSPGATADISVPLQAPPKPGTHRGRWRLRTSGGQDFGDRPFVQIVVPPPATATPWVTPSPTPGPKPDLDVTLVAGKLHLSVGEPLALEVTVQNHGPGGTDRAALVRLVLRPDLVLEDSVPALPAGAQATARFTHTPDAPAELEVFISVDPEGEIAEAEEYNNAQQIRVTVNPPVFATGTFTATAGASFDLDAGGSGPEQADFEWHVVDGSVYLRPRNDAGAARLSGQADRISYALVAGSVWETGQLPLADPIKDTLFAFRTSDGRVGYARVATLLGAARSGARLNYLVWDWP